MDSGQAIRCIRTFSYVHMAHSACNRTNEGQREEATGNSSRGECKRRGEREFGVRVVGEERREPTNRVKEEA